MNEINKKTDRLVVIISDIEMGRGGALDDFPHSDWLGEKILQYNEEPYSRIEVDLVFNGDVFDFLKTSVNGEFPHLIDEHVGLAKLEVISAAHKDFFLAVDKFLQFQGRSRRVHFIVGNHDPELLFPRVQAQIVDLCGGSGQIFFPGMETRIGDLHIEHGNQHDSLFKIPIEKPFLNYKGKKILNMPWSSVTILNVIMPMQETLYHLDRLKPKKLLFERVPELKEFMMQLLWNYWTGDYIKDYLRSTDPLKKISWTMVKEALKRSFDFNPDVEIEADFQHLMRTNGETRVYCIGHLHEAHVWSYGNRKVIQSGCMRNEFMLGEKFDDIHLMPKSYIEVEMCRNRVLLSNLKEIVGPEIPPNYVPMPLSDFLPFIRSKLGPAEGRLQQRLEMENQEHKEKK